MHTRCPGVCIDFWACALTNHHGSGIFHRWIIILTFWSASKSCLFVFWTDFLCWSVFEQLRNGSINLRLYLSIYFIYFLKAECTAHLRRVHIWSILQATEAPKERENWFQDFFPPPITYEYGFLRWAVRGFCINFLWLDNLQAPDKFNDRIIWALRWLKISFVQTVLYYLRY